MKVGEYVRTKDYQNIRSRIGKIIKQDKKYYYLDIDEDTQMVWEEDTILKSSKKIIDLIEVGDYVNGSQVVDIAQAPKKALYTEDIRQKGALIPIINNEIKSIVTKEQFKNMEYKLEVKDE